MVGDSGTFLMKTAEQLFAKLLKDYQRVQDVPDDSEAWFNFFVTADHMAEWHLEDEDDARDFRSKHALLRVCHHLSINSKHWKKRPPKPGTIPSSWVEGTNHVEWVRDGGPPQREFSVTLFPREAAELGREILALDLARQLVDFWRAQLGK